MIGLARRCATWWLAALLLARSPRAGRVAVARSDNETRFVPQSPAPFHSFLQEPGVEPYVENPSGWRTFQPHSDQIDTSKMPMKLEDELSRSMFKGLTDLNNEQLNSLNIDGPDGMQMKHIKNIAPEAPQGTMRDELASGKTNTGGPLEWRQEPDQRMKGGKERKAGTNIAATTYEVGRYKFGQQCTQAASPQFRNSKRISITFMNNRFGGKMPPLVIATVHKPRTHDVWDHAYNANIIDVTPHGFVVEVARLDRDAGWCYELDLEWMAYGFATGDEQMIDRDPEPWMPFDTTYPIKPPPPPPPPPMRGQGLDLATADNDGKMHPEPILPEDPNHPRPVDE